MQLVFINALPGRDAEFNDWYDNIHMRDALRLPGAVSARRYAACSGSLADFAYLTIHESSDPESSARACREHAGTDRMMIAGVCDARTIINASFYPVIARTRRPSQTIPADGDLTVEMIRCRADAAHALESLYCDRRIPAWMAREDVIAAQLLRWEPFGQASAMAPALTHVALVWTGRDGDAGPLPGNRPRPAMVEEFRTARYRPIGRPLTPADVHLPSDAARALEEAARRRFSSHAPAPAAARGAFGIDDAAPANEPAPVAGRRRSSVADIDRLEEPPSQSIEEERTRRKRRLAGAYRIFAMKGFDNGLAGHITVRDPEYADRFWVAPLGRWFGAMQPGDLVEVDHQGNILSGAGVINSAGFAIHSAIHKVRPDVVCAAHSHSVHGKAWSTLGRLLDPITQDATFFYDNHVVVDDFSGVVLAAAEGERIARTLGGKRAAILASHGILTVGRSVESAVANYVALENACQVQLLAEAAGKPAILPDTIAAKTDNQKPDHDPGKFAFAPLWEQMLRSNPDFAADAAT